MHAKDVIDDEHCVPELRHTLSMGALQVAHRSGLWLQSGCGQAKCKGKQAADQWVGRGLMACCATNPA
jgi:hypothetical protein